MYLLAACNCSMSGLMRCTANQGDIFNQICCNYFDLSGACVVECPASMNKTANTVSNECECLPGYMADGNNCVEIDECDPNPCQNGSTCTNLLIDFSCNCTPGFTGKTCNASIDNCNPNPCQNGTCTNMLNDFSCNCTPGFTGNTCNTSIDNCNPNPCQNGGTCNEDFPCTCALGYRGNVCSDCAEGFLFENDQCSEMKICNTS